MNGEMAVTSPLTDADAVLIARARGGDVEAFSRLMEEQQSRLLGQALIFCRDAHLAQDLVQETMLAAWKSFSRFDGTCRLFTWLYVILLRQHQRAQGWFARRLPPPTPEQTAAAVRSALSFTPAAAGLERRESEQLRRLVAQLPERHRDVIRLRFYAEASEAEIAATLGISPGTVKSRLHYALEKLRRIKEKVNPLREALHPSH